MAATCLSSTLSIGQNGSVNSSTNWGREVSSELPYLLMIQEKAGLSRFKNALSTLNKRVAFFPILSCS